jgi:dimethylhistidine N-methyltransferase
MENTQLEFYDFEPRTSSVLKEVLAGLSQGQKSISPKFLYDKKGSEIFEEICQLEEYYPTRAEEEILNSYAKEISRFIGVDSVIIEPGSGSGEKVRLLLPHLSSPEAYVPIEISKEILLRMTEELHEEFPALKVLPVCMDFTKDLDLPLTLANQSGKKVIFFPGSTVGNFAPHEAIELLKKFSRLIGHGGGVLIGADLKKDQQVLERAYDDALGVTAAFNLNLLQRLNREVDAEFNLNNFHHRAIYNPELGRIEMHLVSRVQQMVRVNQTVFRFREGETIHTESSYKYSTREFIDLCGKAKLGLKKFWKDEKGQFCVYYFEKE